MHNDLRRDYRTVLDRLARDIVRVAEQTPLGPSHAPEPSGTANPARTATPFVIAVLSPTTRRLPPERDSAAYGSTPLQWRPFRDAQARPIVDYAASVAERLGLPTQIVDFASIGDAFVASPGVLIIDPWIIAGPPWSTTLADVARALPQWVTPLVIVDKRDPQYGSRGGALTEQATSMLPFTGIPRERVRRQAPVADDVEEFVRLMPMIVAQTRRKFLRHHPAVRTTDVSSARPWSDPTGVSPLPQAPKEDQ
jgi:FxsC-like protein